MKYKFIILFLIILTFILIILKNDEKFTTDKNKENIMTNKKYFEHFNELDFKLRKIKNFSNIDYVYKNGIIKLNQQQEEMLETMIDDFKILLGKNFFKIFENIEFIIVKNYIEHSLPHTRERKIILSENLFDNYNEQYLNDNHFLKKDTYLQKLIAHEQFHIFQRYNLELINILYKDYWELEKFDEKLPLEILNINRTNPDALPNQNWLFKINSNKYILPLCLYDKNPTTISDTSNIYIVVTKKNNKFYINNLKEQLNNRKLLINNQKFKEYFGRESANNYHPNELSSSLFEIIVSDQINEIKSKLVMDRIKNNRVIAYKKMKKFLVDFHLF